jgi:hypothetical protein
MKTGMKNFWTQIQNYGRICRIEKTFERTGKNLANNVLGLNISILTIGNQNDN